jgi:hypothetical protein
VVFWYVFPRFGMLYQEKSGNPAFGITKQKEDFKFGLQIQNFNTV